MKKLLLALIGTFGLTLAFGAEGDTGTMAFQWSGYSDLNPTAPKTYSLADFKGKVILMNAFQYNCGGCDANAPKLGRMADSIGSGQASIPFQGVGTEIDNGTYTQIQTSYVTQLKKNAPNINYPLVHVPFDTAITTDGVGTKWHRYNTYRDVYFVIDATGKIVFRVAGDRQKLMPDSNFQNIRKAIAAALLTAPTPILCLNSCGKNGLKAYQRDGRVHFNFGSDATGPITLQILDLQGRMVRVFSVPAGSEAVWNGMGKTGNASYGTYFVKATGSGMSVSQRINWLP